MFQTLNGKGNRFWTTAAGLVVVSFGVGVLILIPLFYHQDISMSAFSRIITAPPRSDYTPSPPPASAGNVVRTLAVQFNPDWLYEPPVIPARIVTVSDEQPALPGIFVADPRAVPGGMPDFVSRVGVPQVATPPPAPPVERAQPEVLEQPPQPPIRVWIGGDLQAARLISQPRTPYPPLARQMRVEGTVRLEAIINMDGTIEDLRVLSGHPLLVQAALDSVSQWRYVPTLLNGGPVEVMTIIEIHFTLAR